MRLRHTPVLTLNASYEPINVTDAQNALKMLALGKAMIPESEDGVYEGRQVRVGFTLPSVIRLCTYRNIPYRYVSPKRTHIYLRDGHTCQYCGIRFKPHDLTLDHVIPKCRGGQDTWENLVSACKVCNNAKADMMPEEAAAAGLVLRQKPRPSSVHTSRHLMRLMGEGDPEWRKYLYY